MTELAAIDKHHLTHVTGGYGESLGDAAAAGRWLRSVLFGTGASQPGEHGTPKVGETAATASAR